MSRGPGKWQKAILEKTNQGQIVTIPDLLDEYFDNYRSYKPGKGKVIDLINADWSRRVAIERAIKTLAKKGLIRLGWGSRFRGAYTGQWVALPISVDYPTQHLDTVGNEIKIFPAEPGADARSWRGIHHQTLLPANSDVNLYLHKEFLHGGGDRN